jgi:hypothetical protein
LYDSIGEGKSRAFDKIKQKKNVHRGPLLKKEVARLCVVRFGGEKEKTTT